MAYAGPNVFAKAQSDQQRYVEQLQQQGTKVIETGWTFAAGAVTLPYMCYTIVGVTPEGHDCKLFHITAA
jgi:hypothetical protein